MMRRSSVNTRVLRSVLFALASLCLTPALFAADVTMAAIQYPEGSGVTVNLVPTNRVAPAQAEASVKFKNGQATVEVDYKKLPPATLFGGDVPPYSVWAVALA